MKQHDFIKDPDGDDIVISDVKKRKLDIVPRIICLIVAVIIWIYFVNVNDSSVTATFKVKLDVYGTDTLKNNSGQMLYGLDTQEVTITVKGTNRDLKKYSATDYSAKIDVSDITGFGKHSVEVMPIFPTDVGLSLSVISIEPQNVTFYTDLVETKTVNFEAVKGGEVTTPYNLDVIQNKTSIDITGPKSMVEKIETAKYSIKSGDYHTSTKFSGFKVDFYDVNGDVVPYDEKNITYSTDNVMVELAISTESTMGIELYVDEKPAPSNIKFTHNDIVIIGDPTVILSDAIKSSKVKVNVRQSDIEVGQVSVRIHSDDLPNGVMLKEDYVDLLIIFNVLE